MPHPPDKFDMNGLTGLDQSSPDDLEVDDDFNLPSLPAGDGHGSPSASAAKPAAPVQKRRRVTRACDECRRKKIKCDGKQPCTHCTVYSYDCTYDQPSNRRRNPTPQYIEALEMRLQRAESILRTVLPNVDLSDPNIDAMVLQQAAGAAAMARYHTAGRSEVSSSVGDPKSPRSPFTGDAQTSMGENGIGDEAATLRTMIEGTGQLDLDEDNKWDFHGSSSSIVFLRRMREQFGGIMGDKKGVVLPRVPPAPALSHFSGDTPRSGTGSVESPLDSTTMLDLPRKETAVRLCQNALNGACTLNRFMHQPSFYAMVDRIYDTSLDGYGSEENNFLPLLYSVLAVGSVFGDVAPHHDDPEHAAYKSAIEEGLKYFQAARSMIEVTDCRDLTGLQCVVFIILFLQSSANLNVCYSYLGVALRSAIRLGLHRNLSGNFNPIERETRKRTFWVIRKMDILVSAMLGYPQVLSDADIDQLFPTEVDDENITKDTIQPMAPGRTPLMAAANAHARLMGILAKVIVSIYPTKAGGQSAQGDQSYSVSQALIREIEGDLQDWLDRLPMGLRPVEGAPEEMLRAQHLLRMAYGYVQMMLYRPFLHYVSPKTYIGKNLDQRSYACAAAGVSVSRNIVHITAEMNKRGLLTGAYWYSMLTTFFAILTLVYFVLENPDAPGAHDMLKDATTGKATLQCLAKRSLAADRCAVVLQPLFDQLPEHLLRVHTEQQNKAKKRSAPDAISKSFARSNTFEEEPARPSTASAMHPYARASTFPTQLAGGQLKSPTHQFSSPGQLRTPMSIDASTLSMFDTSEASSKSYSDMKSPTELSASLTPESVPNMSFQPSLLNPDLFGTNDPFPDLGTMMFPSTDPFAYPNQPLMEFDNHQKNLGTDMTQPANLFLSGESSTALNNNIEGQMFSPFASYLSRTISANDVTSQVPGMNVGATVNMSADPAYPYSLGNNGTAALDDLFTASTDDWTTAFS